MKVKAILVAMVLVASVATVFAQTAKTEPAKEGEKKSCCMDAKKDKTCKMDGKKTCKMEDGTTCEKSKCDTKAKANGKCPKCADANKSGSCDHKEAKK
jgi:hypothetical protein